MAENSTSSQSRLASLTASMAACRASSRVLRKRYFRWMSEEEMKVWIRGRLAALTALAQTSMSFLMARARPVDHRLFEGLGDFAYRLEIARGGHGKSRFDDVHAQLFQLDGDLHFFLGVQAGAGGLLPVPQRGVENVNLFFG